MILIDIPLPSITWSALKTIYAYIRSKLKIDVLFESGAENPSINVVRDILMVRYVLSIETHGLPKIYPAVVFHHFKGIGEVKKKTVTPSTYGIISEACKLILYTNELRSNSKDPLHVDFEIKIDPTIFYEKTFPSNQVIDATNTSCHVICTNKNNFKLDHIPIFIEKHLGYTLSVIDISILDPATQNKIDAINPTAIRKSDEGIKWYTAFKENETVHFLVET